MNPKSLIYQAPFVSPGIPRYPSLRPDDQLILIASLFFSVEFCMEKLQVHHSVVIFENLESSAANALIIRTFFNLLFPKAFGFSFPSFDTNEALEQIKEAGKQIIEKAKGHAEKVQETVQRKKAELEELPTESMREMWRQIKEKAGDHEAKWQERKKQMKEMWENMKEKAGENKEVFKKMWKENKKNWRDVTEEVSIAPPPLPPPPPPSYFFRNSKFSVHCRNYLRRIQHS